MELQHHAGKHGTELNVGSPHYHGPSQLDATADAIVGGSSRERNWGRTTRYSTSTISSSAGGNGAYPPMSTSLYSSKAVLNINGKLDSMADNWTQEEWDNRRRIVMFRRTQSGSTLTANFRAVPVNERPPNSVCISCIS